MPILKNGLLGFALLTVLAACNPKPELLWDLSSQAYPKKEDPEYERSKNTITSAVELSEDSKQVIFPGRNPHVMKRVNNLFQKEIEGLIAKEGLAGTLDILDDHNFECQEYHQSLHPISDENFITCKVFYSNNLVYLFRLPWQEKELLWPMEWTILLLDTESEQVRVKTFVQPMAQRELQEFLEETRAESEN